MSLTAQQFDSVQCVRFGYEYGLADVIVKNKYYTKEALKALCLQCLKEKEAHIKRIERNETEKTKSAVWPKKETEKKPQHRPSMEQ